MEDKYKLVLLITLKNIITIICFTILAIVFNKWWIIFFSLLFLTYLSTNKKDE